MPQDPAFVSRRMARVRSKHSQIEQLLRRALFRRGLRYRLHAALPGRPDIVFVAARVCVFVDSEFWHGFRWSERRAQIRVNRAYWIPKIERTMERDRATSRQLRRAGWCVMRFWGRTILRDADAVAASVEQTIRQRR